jgi:plasmid stabilization system protein ParE
LHDSIAAKAFPVRTYAHGWGSARRLGWPEASMSAFIVAPEAEEDIFHIWLYLLREAGLETANRIEDEIPGRSRYTVVYRAGVPLEIIAVLHGKRNVKRLLDRRLPPG